MGLLAALSVPAPGRAEPPPEPGVRGAAAPGGLSDTVWNQLPETTPLAVMLIDEGQRTLDTLSQRVADPLGGTSGLLLPVFVHAGYFDLIFAGHVYKLQRSDFDHFAEHLLLGQVSVETVADPADPDLAVVRAHCQAKLYDPERGYRYIPFEVLGEGVEYRHDRARTEALEELQRSLVRRVRALMETP
ncbi:MAG: hypothetical protein SX243_15760 [Acidobacteriota bacterium]|nr:hypothetical protein [Acidobacteriota bacterium]